VEIIFYKKAIEDFEYWKKSGNKTIQKKIQQLLADMMQHPYIGLGKPEALKYEFTGQWSRRINAEHRIIYDATEEVISVYSLRGHY
jgi:toxin YoeB